MKRVMTKNSVAGFVLLAGSILMAGLPGNAMAKSYVDGARAPTANCTCVAHTATDAKAMLSSWRYFGGPKSPMWR